MLEFCEQDFIESCFEELFEEEDRFAEELETYLENLTTDQVDQLMHQLDAATLVEGPRTTPVSSQVDKVFKSLKPECRGKPSNWVSPV